MTIHLGDEFGNEYNKSNPVPTSITGSLANVGKYQDLGLVIEGLILAAGASLSSVWYDDLEWVRNVIFNSMIDQVCSLYIFGRDTSLNPLFGSYALSSTPGVAVGTSGFRPTKVASVIGHSGKFMVTNNGAVATTYVNIYVQLLGL